MSPYEPGHEEAIAEHERHRIVAVLRRWARMNERTGGPNTVTVTLQTAASAIAMNERTSSDDPDTGTLTTGFALAGSKGTRWVAVDITLQPLEHDLLKEVEAARRYVDTAADRIPDDTTPDEAARRIDDAVVEAFIGLCERIENLAFRRAREEKDYQIVAERDEDPP
jgi:hypothetical protein